MDKKRPPKGHRQKGAGSTIVDKGPQEREGVVIKTWQRMPTQLLHEWTQKEKRPKPEYRGVKAVNYGGWRMKCVLPDAKKADYTLEYAPTTDAETKMLAQEHAALLALSKHCGTLPLEKKLPDTFRDLWVDTIASGADDGNATMTGSGGPGLVSDRWYDSKAAKEQKIHADKNVKAQKRNVQEAKTVLKNLPRFYLSERMRQIFATALKTESAASTSSPATGVDEQLMEAFVQKGFDAEDIVQCWSALEGENNAAPTEAMLLNKLLVTVAEEALPETFKPKGEFSVQKPLAPKSALKAQNKSRKEAFLDWLKVVLSEKCDESTAESMYITAEVFLDSEDNLDDFTQILSSENVELEALADEWTAAFQPEEEESDDQVEEETATEQPNEQADFDARPETPEVKPSFTPAARKPQPWFSASIGRPKEFADPFKEDRTKLPAFKVKEEFAQLVDKQVVTLVRGETGCGKSTQLPQFLPINSRVIVTQPRRLAALALASRVAAERGETVGEQSVGCSMRGETRISRTCSLIFCTIGVLLRKVFANDPDMELMTHLVIDEAHERSLDMDLLLTIIRKKRFPFKIILMSATMDADTENMWKNVGSLHIQGRTFPVSELYCHEDLGIPVGDILGHIDFEAIIEVITRCRDGTMKAPKGAILVFLPGVGEIEQLRWLLQKRSIEALPLHGGLPPAEQKKAFRQYAGKIVLTTNVAETSITVPDITVVIDSCQERRLTSVSDNRIPKLDYAFCTKSSIKQRKGRAGRVAPGVCVRMISKNFAESRPNNAPPEMAVLPLDSTLLQLLSAGFPNDLLLSAPTPPTANEIDKARRDLEELGALNSEGVTPLGHHLARLPCDCRVGKLLVYGALLGCAEEAAAVAGMLSVRNPFLRAKEDQEEKRRQFVLGLRPGGQISDHCLWAAVNLAPLGETRPLGLARESLLESKKLRDDLLRQLASLGFRTSGNSEGRWHLLRAACAAAFYPQVAKVKKPETRYTKGISGAMEEKCTPKEVKYFVEAGRVFCTPASVMFSSVPHGHFVVYSSLRVISDKNSGFDKWLLEGASDASPHALLFFGGTLRQEGNQLQVGQLRFQGGSQLTAALIEAVRREVSTLLRRKIDNPELDIDKEPVVVAMRKCLITSGMG
eukprot:GEMP01004484.1.p1 GENE.GEMP01004484.1~~GEMP01004484.1.p1  ORF type:complete len:1134 (+),score=294.52 GEMP01004484.1:166-3567(+)